MNGVLPGGPGWQRRARPLLGTLVEVGVPAGTTTSVVDAAFGAVTEVQASLSRFEPTSDVGRFARLGVGDSLAMRPATRTVLAAAAELRDTTAGLFDVSLGTAPHGWECDGGRLTKRDAAARLDLGGIGKGHAVDAAVGALQALRVSAGWVNAGGDLRCFGDIELPLRLRDEAAGGVRRLRRCRTVRSRRVDSPRPAARPSFIRLPARGAGPRSTSASPRRVASGRMR